MNAATIISPCLEKPTKKPSPVTPPTTDQPAQAWFTPEELAAIAAKQPLMSSDEMSAQINRSLGRPLGSK